jgi:hypothetical protein
MPRRYFWYPRSRLLVNGVCKAGFKSLEEVFRGLPQGELLLGFRAVELLRKPPTMIAQIVRDPKDRLLSMHRYFVQEVRHPMPGMTGAEVRDWYMEVWGKTDPTLDEFVLGLPKTVGNHHFRPQHAEHGDLAFIRGRLDNIQPFWYALRQHSPGLPHKFPKVNETSKEAAEWQTRSFDTLSPEAVEIYNDLYGEDETFYTRTAPTIK